MAVDTITILDADGVSRNIYVDSIAGVLAQVLKVGFGADDTLTLASSGSPLPVTDAAVATQTTAAAILAKLSADPATQTTLAAVLAKLSADPATATNQATLNGKDFATQTTLAAVLAKLSADPATQTTLAAVLSALQGTLAVSGSFSSSLVVTSTAPNRLSDVAVADTTSHTLFASSATRRGVIVNNQTSVGLYIKYGTAVSATSFDIYLASGLIWEMPQPIFTGQMTYAFAAGSGTGKLNATELQA